MILKFVYDEADPKGGSVTEMFDNVTSYCTFGQEQKVNIGSSRHIGYGEDGPKTVNIGVYTADGGFHHFWSYTPSIDVYVMSDAGDTIQRGLH